jgi:hypothetical protein
VDSYEKPLKRLVTLGSVRHRHEQTNEIILVPTPSADPNDPLNWYDYHPPLGLHFEVQTR